MFWLDALGFFNKPLEHVDECEDVRIEKWCKGAKQRSKQAALLHGMAFDGQN